MQVHRLSLISSLAAACAMACAPAHAEDTNAAIAALTAQVRALSDQVRQVSALAASQQAALAEVRQSNSVMLTRLTCVTKSTATDFIFDGCNVHIQNGAGSTGSLNSLGNLIIGYNKNQVSQRSGSHNLIVGDLHEYTSYGGVVTGTENTLSAPNSTIMSSVDSSSTGTGGAAIIGADRGTTQGNAVLLGGSQNFASANAHFAVAVGGNQNQVLSGEAVVMAGTLNVASGGSSVACGGSENTASGNGSVACGGTGNKGIGSSAVALGGHHVSASADSSVITGGNACDTGPTAYMWAVGTRPGGCAFTN
jgi:hypothetical protein